MTEEEGLRFVIKRGESAGSIAEALSPENAEVFIQRSWEITEETLKSLYEKGLVRKLT